MINYQVWYQFVTQNSIARRFELVSDPKNKKRPKSGFSRNLKSGFLPGMATYEFETSILNSQWSENSKNVRHVPVPRICYDKLSDQCGLDNHSGINGAPRKYHRKSCKASATAAQIFRLKGKRKKKKLKSVSSRWHCFVNFSSKISST